MKVYGKDRSMIKAEYLLSQIYKMLCEGQTQRLALKDIESIQSTQRTDMALLIYKNKLYRNLKLISDAIYSSLNRMAPDGQSQVSILFMKCLSTFLFGCEPSHLVSTIHIQNHQHKSSVEDNQAEEEKSTSKSQFHDALLAWKYSAVQFPLYAAAVDSYALRKNIKSFKENCVTLSTQLLRVIDADDLFSHISDYKSHRDQLFDMLIYSYNTSLEWNFPTGLFEITTTYEKFYGQQLKEFSHASIFNLSIILDICQDSVFSQSAAPTAKSIFYQECMEMISNPPMEDPRNGIMAISDKTIKVCVQKKYECNKICESIWNDVSQFMEDNNYDFWSLCAEYEKCSAIAAE